MADEIEDLELIENDEVNKTEQRIKNLSEKVKLTAKERDELDALNKQKDEQLGVKDKEIEFYKSFSQVVTKPEFAAASEYQDSIREKVLGGYTVEDATLSVLNKEGKYTPPPPKAPEAESPAGGSAINTLQSGTDKSVGEMNREEKRAALMEAERRGDIVLS